MVVTEDMQVYRSRPLPLGDRTSRADVDIPRDPVAVVAGDPVAVQIDDIQVAFPNLPHDVVVLLRRRHHQVEILLETVVVFRADPGLHHTSAVVADGGDDDYLVGKSRGPVDDRPESLAGPACSGERGKLSQFRCVVVNDV
jgi:hypothetical protein